MAFRVRSVFADSSTDVDIFFLRWVKTPSIGFHSSFVTSLLSKRVFFSSLALSSRGPGSSLSRGLFHRSGRPAGAAGPLWRAAGSGGQAGSPPWPAGAFVRPPRTGPRPPKVSSVPPRTWPFVSGRWESSWKGFVGKRP
uniref:Uncharacterized protein n=1 Tax=Dromaius novaehollandiae TaxID=8790 RepID=A0A8C4KDU1_DRONO